MTFCHKSPEQAKKAELARRDWSEQTSRGKPCALVPRGLATRHSSGRALSRIALNSTNKRLLLFRRSLPKLFKPYGVHSDDLTTAAVNFPRAQIIWRSVTHLTYRRSKRVIVKIYSQHIHKTCILKDCYWLRNIFHYSTDVAKL